MTTSDLLFLLLILFDEHQIIIKMIRSWLLKILLCFSHTHIGRRKQQQKPTPYVIMGNVDESQAVSSYPSVCHVFSPPLKVCMLRKIGCRTQPRTLDNNLVTLPLSITSSRQQPITYLLNESQNCVETLSYGYTSSIIRCKQNPSLIAIDIGNNEFSQEQAPIRYMKQSEKFCSPIDKSKIEKKIRLHQ